MSELYSENTAELAGTVKCCNCAANLSFKPGTDSLVCPYCNTQNTLASAPAEIIENDYRKFLSENGNAVPKEELTVCKCSNCGASTTLPPNVTSSTCPYCDTPLVLQNAATCSLIKPKYLLPFKIERNQAKDKFIAWVKGLWFAPNKLIDYARHSTEKLNGVYMPYWTYDSNTVTNYNGERGEYYYVSVSYKDANGNTKTRQERRTRWYPASGTVNEVFDDVLVCAAESLPHKLSQKLEPWDLKELVDFDPRFLAGFLTESYQLNLEHGFEKAKNIMSAQISVTVKSHIGGDTQRVHNMNTSYNDIMFKHILLPLWISAYKYNNKTYRFTVNARTGEVVGERPYSFWKIFLLVASIIVTIAAIIIIADGGE